MDHLVYRVKVTYVLYDGPKTHVVQQPNGYGPQVIDEIDI